MHLDDEQLQRLLHGELAPPDDGEARRHLAGCLECRERREGAEREEARILALLGRVDHPVPRVSLEELRAVAARRARRGWVRWAAGIVLVLGAGGVAFAAPGSPLRGWVERALAGEPRDSVPQAVVPDTASTDQPARGVMVAPGNRFTVVFPAGLKGAVARVYLRDDPGLVVRALQGNARFTIDLDRVQVAASDSGMRFEILVPRSAPLVVVRAGSRQLFQKRGAEITTTGREEAGRYRVPLDTP